MNRFLASIIKETQLLVHDRVGLLILYLMPMALVFVITIVQDSTFRLVNENQLELLIVNHDEGNLGDSLVSILKGSGNFDISEDTSIKKDELQEATIEKSKLLSLYIPSNFSEKLNQNAGKISSTMLHEFGLVDSISIVRDTNQQFIALYYDPVLQDNFRLTLTTNLNSILFGIENKVMLEKFFTDMGYDKIPENIHSELIGNKTELRSSPAGKKGRNKIPNSSQHNVPAWSVFAMFFMVISLAGNLVKERNSGSFVRLQTIPGSFMLTIYSKMVVYMFVAVTQLIALFIIGMTVFPLIGLPRLDIPPHYIQLAVMTLLSALTAVSFSILIGTYAKTQEQSNGFGAVTVIIFAAIGGIWVPSFIMPNYLQQIGKISPLHWCLEGFYALFLKNGEWSELAGPIIFLTLFIGVCQLLTFIKLRTQNYI